VLGLGVGVFWSTGQLLLPVEGAVVGFTVGATVVTGFTVGLFWRTGHPLEPFTLFTLPVEGEAVGAGVATGAFVDTGFSAGACVLGMLVWLSQLLDDHTMLCVVPQLVLCR